jgi:hypothetical protein
MRERGRPSEREDLMERVTRIELAFSAWELDPGDPLTCAFREGAGQSGPVDVRKSTDFP